MSVEAQAYDPVLAQRIADEVTRGRIFDLLPDEVQDEVREIPGDEVYAAARNVLIRPQPGAVSQGDRVLLNPCLAVSWLAVFEELDLPRSLRVWEPCAGSSEPVILATEVYSHGQGQYTTINLNRILAGQLREKLAKLRMPVQIIEDDVSRSDIRFAPGSADVACFHHAINDILQTAVSEPRGMDTRAIEWWSNEQQMIEWLGEDDRAGRLDDRARPALLQAVQHACDLVAPGGYLIFDHWTWVAYETVDWFPWDLFQRLIPMAREWIEASGLPLNEVSLSGRDPQWWMAFQRQ